MRARVPAAARRPARSRRHGSGEQVAHGRHGRIVGGTACAGAGAPVEHLARAVPDLDDAVRERARTPVGERDIGAGELQQRHLAGAEREARIGRERTLDAEPARRRQHPLHARAQAHAHRHGVDRAGKTLPHRHRAPVFAVIVAGRPAGDGDRRVLDQVVRAEPGLQPREIDHRLEGRAGLAPRLGRPVEHAARVVAPADHGAHRAALVQRDEGALADPAALAGGGEGLGERRLRRPLAGGIEGRADAERAVVAPDIARHLLQHPIDEIAGGWARAPRDREGLHPGPGARSLAFAEEARVHHRIDHDAGAPACQRQVVGGAVARRRLQQARDHGGLGGAEIARRAAEIAPRGGIHAIGAGTEIGAVEVDREDLVLAELALQPEGEHRLLDLAPRAALRREEHQFRHLLGDRAAAGDHAALDRVLPCRPDHAEGVDAAVGRRSGGPRSRERPGAAPAPFPGPGPARPTSRRRWRPRSHRMPAR